MFELILQADRAMAEGQFDRAERTYWQLIELDPSNAMALAGLARFSIERGDDRLARALARRALSIDPESILAKRVLDALDNPGSGKASSLTKDLTLVAAEQLEALGRRRRQILEAQAAAEEAAEEAAAALKEASSGGSIRAEIEAEAAAGAGDPAAGRGATRSKSPAEEAHKARRVSLE